MSRNTILIALIVVIAVYFYMNSKDKEAMVTNPDSGNQELSAQVESPALEAENKKLIEKLVEEGFISKIDLDGDTPKVYVTADYYRIPEVDKRAIMEVLFDDFRTNNPEVTSFSVYDAKSGDEVATYGEKGLKEK